LGSDTVARSRETLAGCGVTHVLNATAHASAEYFRAVPVPASEASPLLAADGAPALLYRSLWLQDTPGEDLCCVLYDALDWLHAARSAGGRVLVHCSQGVSRSAALCIGYLMWRDGAGFDDTFAAVKRSRGVANPNMGFACQLLQWAKRRGCPPDATRIYRVQPQSAADPRYLVARQLACPGGDRGAAGLAQGLDSRGAFVVHWRGGVCVWRGAACPEPFHQAALRFAVQLARYEGAPEPAWHCCAGDEPQALLDALGAGAEARGPGGVGLLGAPQARCAAYDADFALFQQGLRCEAALRGGVGAQEAAESGCPGRSASPQRVHRDGREAAQGHWGGSRDARRMSTPTLHSGRAGWGAPAQPQPPASLEAPPSQALNLRARISSPFIGALLEPAEGEEDLGGGGEPAEEGLLMPALYEFPSLERLHIFDEDDLRSGAAYLLLTPRQGVHVWLGAEFAHRLAPGDGPQAAAARVAAALRASGVALPPTPPRVQLEGAEEPDFLQHFD